MDSNAIWSGGLLLINPVAVEKVGFPEQSQKSGGRECLGDSGKSFIELPDAKQFFVKSRERVFQQLPLFSTAIRKTSVSESTFRVTGTYR